MLGLAPIGSPPIGRCPLIHSEPRIHDFDFISAESRPISSLRSHLLDSLRGLSLSVSVLIAPFFLQMATRSAKKKKGNVAEVGPPSGRGSPSSAQSGSTPLELAKARSMAMFSARKCARSTATDAKLRPDYICPSPSPSNAMT